MMRFETLALHAGQEPDPQTGAVSVPVYQVSTFRQDAIGRPRGYEYARTGNPTRTALETCLAALEGGAGALAFASGMAATTAVLQGLKPGDHVVAGDDLYGGTYRLFEQVFRPWGLSVSYVPASDPAAFEAAIGPRTRLLWLETPTNPLLKIVDIEAVAAVAARHGLGCAVDNTFAGPYGQRPLALGATHVVHSTTKYIGGHSDLIGGAVVVRRAAAMDALRFHQNAVGAVPGPWDCWLALRGLKTLAVRMDRHAANAMHLARLLSRHPAVARVHYPGLPDHPGHAVACRQMTNFGGMIGIELKGGRAAVERVVSRLRLFLLAESLGGVESLVCYPPVMTHAALPPDERARRGIGDNLLRLSVGIEHVTDLEADLNQALATP